MIAQACYCVPYAVLKTGRLLNPVTWKTVFPSSFYDYLYLPEEKAGIEEVGVFICFVS